MKANELMIGDWVRITDDDTDAFFDARVGTLTRVENIFVVPPGEEMAQPFSIDCVEPIPITPEILEKNGFSRNGLDISLFDRRGGDDFVGASNLQYVHELQHALRLCGIEKEIVL